jgi:hypothetical protein
VLHHLAQILVHLGRLLLVWSEKQSQLRALSGGPPAIYSFEQHMRNLAEQTSIPLVALKPDCATFHPSFKGRSYVTVLFHQGSTIAVGMFSNICFPPGGIPPQVCDMIRGLAQPSDGFRLVPTDGPEGSFVIADSSGPASELTPEAFSQRMEKMMLVLALLDAIIMERGLSCESGGMHS